MSNADTLVGIYTEMLKERERELQTAIPAAIAKATKTLNGRLATAVLEACGGEYLHASELFNKPGVRPLTKDRAHLSYSLSHAYDRGLVGRVFAPLGRETFAYGPVGQQAERRRAIRAEAEESKPEPKVVGYSLTVPIHEADRVLRFVEDNKGMDVTWQRGSAVGEEDVPFFVTIKLATKGDVLDYLLEKCASFMVAEISISEVHDQP